MECLLTVVQGDDVESIQQLAFVLVDPLDMNIKHGVDVDADVVVLLQVIGQFHLVFLEVGSTSYPETLQSLTRCPHLIQAQPVRCGHGKDA